MKINKILRNTVLGALVSASVLFGGCNNGFTGSNIDYNLDEPAITSDGLTPNQMKNISIDVLSADLVANTKSNLVKVEIISSSKLNFDKFTYAELTDAFSFYALEEEPSILYPVRKEKIPFVVSNDYIPVEKASLKEVKTTITFDVDLTGYKTSKLAAVLDATKLKNKNGNFVLNGNGNETAGEESDSLIEYLSVDAGSVDSFKVISSSYKENFAPVYDYDADFEWTKDSNSGALTGTATIIVPAVTYNGVDYLTTEAGTLGNIYSLKVRPAEAKNYKEEILTFEYDEAKKAYVAESATTYAAGTTVVLVKRYSNSITTDFAEQYYGHKAKFSYFKTPYIENSLEYVLGYIDAETTTIVSLSDYSQESADAVFAQNMLLDVSKTYTSVIDATEEVNCGTVWTVKFNEEYSYIANAFGKTDGFIVTNAYGIKIPSTLTVLEKDEDGNATKIKVSVNDSKIDGSGFDLWIGSGSTILENKVNAQQIYFGTTADLANGAASGYSRLAADRITSNNSNATRYALTAIDNSGSGKIHLKWDLISGKSGVVRIYKNGAYVTEVNGAEYDDTNVSSGTNYKYQLKTIAGVDASDQIIVNTASKLPAARFTIGYDDYTESNGYINLTINHVEGTETGYGYFYRDGSLVTSFSSNPYTRTEYVLGGQTYEYVIKDSTGKVISDTLKITFPKTVYSFSSDTKYVASSGYVQLKWNRISGPRAYNGYTYIYRNGEQIASSSNLSSSYNDSDVESGKSYKYDIRDSYGNIISEAQTIVIPNSYYNLSTANPYNNYDQTEISWRRVTGSTENFNVYRNDKKIGTYKDTTYILENDLEPGRYTYYIRDDEGYKITNDVTVTIPETKEISYVINTNVKQDPITGKISVHMGPDYWQSEFFQKIEAETGYTKSDLQSVIRSDAQYEATYNFDDLKAGKTAYFSTSSYFVVQNTIKVTDTAESFDINDYQVADLSSGHYNRYYKLNVTKGKAYGIQFYNGYFANNSYYSGKMVGASSYTWYNSNNFYCYLYKIDDDGNLSQVYANNGYTNVSFVAEDDVYIVRMYYNYTSAERYSAFHAYETGTSVEYTALDGTKETFSIPTSGYTYAKTDSTSYNWKSISGISSNIRNFIYYNVNPEYTPSRISYYTDSSYKNAASYTDFVKGAKLYAKPYTISPKTAPAAEFADFDVFYSSDYSYDPKDGIYERIYKLTGLVAGQPYVVQLYSGNSKDHSWYTDGVFDKTGDTAYSWYSGSSYSYYNIYEIDEDGESSLIYNGYGNSYMDKQSFVAKPNCSYEIKSRLVYSGYSQGIYLYEAETLPVYVVDSTGKEEEELSVQYGCYSGSSMVSTIAGVATALNNAYGYGYSYYEYGTSKDFTDEPTNTDVTEGNDIYIRKRVIVPADSAASKLSEFTRPFYNSNFAVTQFNYDFETIAGEAYSIELYNSNTYGSYSTLEIDATIGNRNNNPLRLYKYDADTGDYVPAADSFNNYKEIGFIADCGKYRLSIFVNNSANYNNGAHIYKCEKSQITILGAEETVVNVPVVSYSYAKDSSDSLCISRTNTVGGILNFIGIETGTTYDINTNCFYTDKACTIKATDLTTKGNFYLAIPVLKVKTAAPTSVNDFEITTYSSNYVPYEVKLEAGKLYTLALLNSNTSGIWGNRGVTGTSSYSWDGTSNSTYLYKVTVDDGKEEVWNGSLSAYTFKAETTGKYIIETRSSSNYKGVYLYETPMYTVHVGANTYTVPKETYVPDPYDSSVTYDTYGKVAELYSYINALDSSAKLDVKTKYVAVASASVTPIRDAGLSAENELYIKDYVLPVTDHVPNSIDDFTIVSYDSHVRHSYAMTLEKDKNYTLARVYSANKTNMAEKYGLDVSTLSLSSVYNSSTYYDYIYEMGPTAHTSIVYNSYGYDEISFTAEQEAYTLDLNIYNSGSMAYCLFETPSFTVKDGETSYSIPCASTIYYKAGPTDLNYSSKTIASDKANTLNYISNIYGKSYNSNLYVITDDENVIADASASTYKAEAELYMKLREIQVSEGPATDTSKLSFMDDGSSRGNIYRVFATEPGKTYTVEIINNYTKDAFTGITGFDDVTWSTATSNNYALYNGIQTGTAFFSSYQTPSVTFVATTDFVTMLIPGVSANYYAGVNIYEATAPEGNVVTASGSYDVLLGTELKVGGNTYNTATVAGLFSYLNAVCGESVSVQYNEIYSDAGFTTPVETIAKNSTIYIGKRVLPVTTGTASAVTDFTVVKGDGSYKRSLEMTVVPGKSYVVEILNSYTKSSYTLSDISNYNLYNNSNSNYIKDASGNTLYSAYSTAEYIFLAKGSTYIFEIPSFSSGYSYGVRLREASDKYSTVTVVEGENEYAVPLGSSIYEVGNGNRNGSFNTTTISGLSGYLAVANNELTTSYYKYCSDEEGTVLLTNADLIDGATVYLKPLTGLVVGDAAADDISDFTIVKSNATGLAQIVTFETEPGELYVVELLNSNTKSSYSGKLALGDYNFGYSNSVTVTSGKLSFTTASTNYVFKAEATVGKITIPYYSSNYNYGVYVHKDVKTITVVDALTEDVIAADVVVAPCYYHLTQSEESKSYALSTTGNLLTYIGDFYNPKYKSSSIYSDAECTALVSNLSDVANGATVYLKTLYLTVGNGPATSLNDFELVRMNATGAEQILTFTTEPGALYTVELINSNTKAAYSDFAKYPQYSFDSTSSVTVKSGLVSYSISDNNSVFEADSTTSTVSVPNTNSDYTYGVRVHKAYKTVKFVDGETDEELEELVVAPKYAHKVDGGFVVYSITNTAAGVYNYLGSYILSKYATGYGLFEDAESAVKVNMSTVADGATVYLNKLVMPVSASAAASLNDFTLETYDGLSTVDYNLTGIEAGKYYTVELINGTVKGNYSFNTTLTSGSNWSTSSNTVSLVKNGTVFASQYSSPNFTFLAEENAEYRVRIGIYTSTGYVTGARVYENTDTITIRFNEESYNVPLLERCYIDSSKQFSSKSLAYLKTYLSSRVDCGDKIIKIYSDSGLETYANATDIIVGATLYVGLEEPLIANWTKSTSGSYTFIEDEEVWTSNNKNKSSTTASATWTINLLAGAEVSIPWSVSSESSCDKLTIKIDDSTKVSGASGSDSGTIIVTLEAGTHTLTATYSKDSSVDSGTDTATVTLNEVLY